MRANRGPIRRHLYQGVVVTVLLGAAVSLRAQEVPAPPPVVDHPGAPITAACPLAEGGIQALQIDATADLIACEAAHPSAEPAPPVAPWDHVTEPLNLDLVEAWVGLSDAERSTLFANGFVVLDRVEMASWEEAYIELYRRDMPLYISIDGILNAVFNLEASWMEEIELEALAHELAASLESLAAALPTAAPLYPAEVAQDLDLYVTVARRLLIYGPMPSALGAVDEAADALVAQLEEAGPMQDVEIFGRSRVIDFSQYEPRSYYDSFEGDRYFRAAMWLSRLEFNVVTRGCASSTPAPDFDQTPREAIVALALADLAQRSGALEGFERVSTAWRALVGPRDDVSLPDLLQLMTDAHITDLRAPDAFARLQAQIGESGFQRTVNVSYVPPGCTEDLPVIASVLGVRTLPDAHALYELVHPNTNERAELSVADLGYVLGHDQTLGALSVDLGLFPDLAGQLDVARSRLAAALTAEESAANQWLKGVVALAQPPTGVLPTFMTTDAFADLRLNSALVGYGQVRHNFVLMAAQAYSMGMCETPDAYVDPAVASLDILIAYTERWRAVREMFAYDSPRDQMVEQSDHLLQALRALRAIVGVELENRPLSEAALHYISQIVTQLQPEDCISEGPQYDGWYMRMLADVFEEPGFVADYFTSSHSSNVAYVGALRPVLGVFVVDTSGPPRVMVGPVARAFATTRTLQAGRLTDADIHEGRLGETASWWRESFLPDNAGVLPIVVVTDHATCAGEWDGAYTLKTIWIAAVEPMADLQVTVYGPHHDELLDTHVAVDQRGTCVALPQAPGVAEGDPAEEQHDGADAPPLMRFRSGGQEAWAVPRLDAWWRNMGAPAPLPWIGCDRLGAFGDELPEDLADEVDNARDYCERTPGY